MKANELMIGDWVDYKECNMTFVIAISLAHHKGVAICLKEWGGYWHFAEDGFLRNADDTLVENIRIAKYANRDDWHIYPYNP